MSDKANVSETIWYLEMSSPDELVRKPLPLDCQLVRLEIPLPALNRFFYTEVGKIWSWTDYLSRSDEEWDDWVIKRKVETWMVQCRGTPAGYFELDPQGRDVEIAHFGLLPIFIGKGIGSGLLSAAIEEAWEMENVSRVWVHTCSSDHPNAYKNYQDRGFKLYKEEINTNNSIEKDA